jgi:hypothetical protein
MVIWVMNVSKQVKVGGSLTVRNDRTTTMDVQKIVATFVAVQEKMDWKVNHTDRGRR